MSDHTSFIKNALEYYDKNNENLQTKLRNVHHYKYEHVISTDTENSVIIFYDKNNNKLFSSRFEIIGIYIKPLKLWAWAWALPNIHKNLSYISRKLLMYGLDLDYLLEGTNLKTELITSRFHIKNILQIDIHLAIASYLTKIKYIFPVKILTEKSGSGIQTFGKINYIYLLDMKD